MLYLIKKLIFYYFLMIYQCIKFENYFSVKQNKEITRHFYQKKIEEITIKRINSDSLISCAMVCSLDEQCNFNLLKSRNCSLINECFNENSIQNNYKSNIFVKLGNCFKNYSNIAS